ncbi:MAG: glycosyltransferase family 2 protein [candidate division NC10 bacterium]|nr:glycosyltransferase family 2 protein [candidate division NC10 bacterium]
MRESAGEAGKGTMRVAALIAAYNAGMGIEAVVKGCRSFCPRVLVVDDGSSDETEVWAWKAGAEVVRHPQNRGKGAALQTGFRILLREGQYDAILTLDADGQHDPSDIPNFLQAAEEKEAGIVVGSRLAHMQGMRRVRRLCNRLSTRCIAYLCGQEIEDSQSGYRLIRTDLLRKIEWRGDRYDLEADLLVQASRAHFPILSIPVAAPVIDGLPTSHYRPFVDSFLIGLTILRHFFRR